MSDPSLGLAVDPRVVSDLLIAPATIRTAAMKRLKALLEGGPEGDELTGALAGYRSISLDQRWRLVYTVRPAPPGGLFPREVFVAVVKPRAHFDVHQAVIARLGLNTPPVTALAHAARSRSPQTSPTRHLTVVPRLSIPAKGPTR